MAQKIVYIKNEWRLIEYTGLDPVPDHILENSTLMYHVSSFNSIATLVSVSRKTLIMKENMYLPFYVEGYRVRPVPVVTEKS